MRSVRKLILHRETLRTLDVRRLRGALGGTATAHENSCPPCPSISFCFACITVPEATCDN